MRYLGYYDEDGKPVYVIEVVSGEVEDRIPLYPTKPVKIEDITQEEIIKRNQQRRKVTLEKLGVNLNERIGMDRF